MHFYLRSYSQETFLVTMLRYMNTREWIIVISSVRRDNAYCPSLMISPGISRMWAFSHNLPNQEKTLPDLRKVFPSSVLCLKSNFQLVRNDFQKSQKAQHWTLWTLWSGRGWGGWGWEWGLTCPSHAHTFCCTNSSTAWWCLLTYQTPDFD